MTTTTTTPPVLLMTSASGSGLRDVTQTRDEGEDWGAQGAMGGV